MQKRRVGLELVTTKMTPGQDHEGVDCLAAAQLTTSSNGSVNFKPAHSHPRAVETSWAFVF